MNHNTQRLIQHTNSAALQIFLHYKTEMDNPNHQKATLPKMTTSGRAYDFLRPPLHSCKNKYLKTLSAHPPDPVKLLLSVDKVLITTISGEKLQQVLTKLIFNSELQLQNYTCLVNARTYLCPSHIIW